jgi:AcrR family transcriptional regulator
MSESVSLEVDKSSRRRQCILNAVKDALFEHDYNKLTIEEVASRAGVGKSTIYRWWKNKSDLVFELFKDETASIFELDFEQSLQHNLEQQLVRLSEILFEPIGRALLVVMAQNREKAGQFFKEYLLPRRKQTLRLIEHAIQRQEIKSDYPFERMLDTLYGPIHYQIIFFNQRPNAHEIHELVSMVLAPILNSSSNKKI